MFKTILTNFHLEKIWWIFKKNLKYMLLSALIFACLGTGFAFYTKSSVYRASISFYVYTNPEYITDSGLNLNSSEITSAKNLLDSYMLILSSDKFLNQVVERMGADGVNYSSDALKNQISSAAVKNTAVFKVYVFDSDPYMAQKIANTIGELAPDAIIDIVKSGGIEILDSAALPTSPFQSTSVVKYAVLSGAAGFALAFLIAMLKGLLNTTIRRKYEVEDMFNIPIVATIPSIVTKKGQKVDKVINDESPFILKEAYSDIRMNLMFTAKGEKCPVYGITSADPKEGKSLNSINIAKSYAQLGKKTIIIDADMRKSTVTNVLDVRRKEQGLGEYLARITDDKNIINVEENFDVMTVSKFPPNPAELLASDRWNQLLDELKNEYEIIIVDLPPIGVVSDALSIAESLTAFIIVVRENYTKMERVEMIVSKLEAIDANICGIVYNGISVKSPDYNYRHYGYEYGYKQ